VSFTWSLSSLGTYERCGFKYRLKYVEKIKETRSTSASRGVDNHAIVENFLKGTIQDVPEELGFYRNFFTGLKSYEIYPEHKISLTRAWTPTKWGAPDSWYRGVLDLKLIDRTRRLDGEKQELAQSAVVYDWKTGKIYPDHDDQKSIYSLAVLSEQPALYQVRAIHVYLDRNESREKTFHRDQVPELRKQWETRVQGLEQDPVFIPNPGFHCRYCSFSREKGGPCQF
jgi:hypothetical protein